MSREERRVDVRREDAALLGSIPHTFSLNQSYVRFVRTAGMRMLRVGDYLDAGPSEPVQTIVFRLADFEMVENRSARTIRAVVVTCLQEACQHPEFRVNPGLEAELREMAQEADASSRAALVAEIARLLGHTGIVTVEQLASAMRWQLRNDVAARLAERARPRPEAPRYRLLKPDRKLDIGDGQ